MSERKEKREQVERLARKRFDTVYAGVRCTWEESAKRVKRELRTEAEWWIEAIDADGGPE